jgi:hypothetical protein
MNRPSAFAVLAVGLALSVTGCGGDSGASHDKAYWDAQRVTLFRGEASHHAFARPTAIALVETAIDTRVAEENDSDLAASGRRFGTAVLADAISFPYVDEKAMTTIFGLWAEEAAIPTAACQAAVPVVLDGLTVIDDERFPEDDVRFARRSMYKACGIPPDDRGCRARGPAPGPEGLSREVPRTLVDLPAPGHGHTGCDGLVQRGPDRTHRKRRSLAARPPPGAREEQDRRQSQ